MECKKWKLLILGLSIGLLFSCNDSSVPLAAEKVFVPLPPDYSDSRMWFVVENDSLKNGADVFYIPSTWEYDWTTPDGLICHYADPSRDDHRNDMAIEMSGIAEYMADGNNFYSPYYRHITLDSWATLNEDTINRRFHDVAFLDVSNAFASFQDSRDRSRPFFLAGFSQGGKSVVELLKTLDAETRSNMVAAYVIGYKVTPQDVIDYPFLSAAEDSVDTGVIICYNSVSEAKYAKPIVAYPNVMQINPVNWKTDGTPAILEDTISVTLDTDANVLIVEGYDGSKLPNILNILNVGDYHGADPWLYSESLRQNFHTRLKSFLEKK